MRKMRHIESINKWQKKKIKAISSNNIVLKEKYIRMIIICYLISLRKGLKLSLATEDL